MKTTSSGSGAPLLPLLGTAAGTIFFGFLWCNNLVSSLRYHGALFAGRTGEATVTGFCPCLDWSAIDVSTVTTFVPFFGFLLMFLGLRRFRRGDEWPFFAGYDRLNVALGLLGTIWGIVLIGFYPAEEISVTALMRCLHTAMFSTLAAIAWVMVLEPLWIRPWMTRLRRKALGADPEESSLDSLTDSLLGGLAAAEKGFREFGSAASTVREELNRFNGELASARETEKRWHDEVLLCLTSLAETVEALKAHQTALASENTALLERNGKLEADLAASAEEAARLRRQLEAVRDALR